MDLLDDVRARLFDAGADAITFNVPLGTERAMALADRLAQLPVERVVDLGCGRGELARLIASRASTATVVGVDTDARLIEAANRLTAEAALDTRVSFEVADAATWTGPVDGAVCVGSSHIFGGSAALFTHLATLVPRGGCLVGDGFWQSAPDPWCVEVFGDMADGIDGLAAEARAAGWTVVDRSASTLAEWDEFEHGWTGGVRAVEDVGDLATAFADEREADYGRYRGVLGFGWLVMTR